MLETKCVGHEWVGHEDTGDGSGLFGHQHPLSFYISNASLASGTKIQKMSQISKFSQQHPQIVTNFKSPT